MNIQEQLAEWSKDPPEYEDYTPPTEDSLVVARALLEIINPMRVVPGGDGGVVFKWSGPMHTPKSLEVEADGSLNFIRWRGATIESRMRWKVYGE